MSRTLLDTINDILAKVPANAVTPVVDDVEAEFRTTPNVPSTSRVVDISAARNAYQRVASAQSELNTALNAEGTKDCYRLKLRDVEIRRQWGVE